MPPTSGPTHDHTCCHGAGGQNPAPVKKDDAHCGHGHDHGHDHGGGCGPGAGRVDWLLWIGVAVISVSYVLHLMFFRHDHDSWAGLFTGAVYELMNSMYIGMLIGVTVMGFLGHIPRPFVMAVLGSREQGRVRAIWRATLAGILFDVCSHAIMMIGAKLYERGASLGQVMAFLIASPWNSLSLTFVLIALIGLKWTLIYTALSAVIALVSGLIFDMLVDKGRLPQNPDAGKEMVDENFDFWAEAKAGLKKVHWTPRFVLSTIVQGFRESGMLIRWLFLGVIITGALRVLIAPDALFQDFFGPTLTGLMVTFVLATIIEICSEGATPIAADIFRRAQATGNAFVFLMAGVSTNYTTVLVLREATKSWKIAFALPLVTVPQVLLLGWVLNVFF